MAHDDPAYQKLNQSCLYKLTNRRRLAKILFASEKALEALSQTGERYSSWEIPKKSGGTRTIEAPHDNLKAIQKRIADLLQKIEPPDYLMAPVKRRSYVHNAAAHIGARAFRLLDIENFFPSCTDKRVFWFFSSYMKCSPDVAAILTRLTTLQGHLPQGSPCSPILAYFAYVDMWEKIDQIVSKSSCRLSIYADDITVSGHTVFERDVWAIKKVLHRHGHRYSREKERSLINKPADITGVIVSGSELLLPNRQHRLLADTRQRRQATQPGKVRDKLDRQLRGRHAQARQILAHEFRDNAKV